MRESILIMASRERVGDHLGEVICAEFVRGSQTSCTLIDSDSQEDLNTLDPEHNKPDIVIVLESMDAFISHRLRIGGRPWVLAASFTFDDIYTLYSNRLALTELGIDAFVSNCAVFLKNMTAVIPSSFCWRPVPSVMTQSEPHCELIGTILDNLLDRDFSLVDHAFKVLEENDLSSKAVVYCHPRIERDRLPERLAKYAVNQHSSDWHSLKYYLPAPRITDLRGGVVPSEILKALAYGCHPLCFAHNALPALGKIFTPQFTCLKSFKSSLLDAAFGKFETHHVVSDATSWRPTVADFVTTVKQMYRRASTANASS